MDKAIYSKERIICIFNERTALEISNNYTMKELTSMYLVIYETKPMSGFNKLRIVQTIKNYIYAMDRARALLKNVENI